MTIVNRVFGNIKRRGMRRTALGLLAVPLVMQSCQPACTPTEPPAAVGPRALPQEVIGTSVQGRPIVAYHVGGTPGGKVVLAIGSMRQQTLPTDEKVRALYVERQQIERRIESLKLLKSGMDPEKYAAELEKLATELALMHLPSPARSVGVRPETRFRRATDPMSHGSRHAE